VFPTTEPRPDREAASKARKRRRIVDAARELLAERAGTDFSVEEVAERAGLSRRTIFNYFPSVDDLLVEVGTEMLGGLVATLRVADVAPVADPVTEDVRAALFAELTEALHTVDLVPAMVQLTQVLGGVSRTHPRVAASVQLALVRLVDRMVTEIRARHPEADLLDVELLAASLVGGLVVLYQHWSAQEGVVDTPRSRATWGTLLDRLVTTVGNGYLHGAPASQHH
jgi:TetR/AcrR family transcriptional regulator of autoinduction and epiphytic fitness